MPPVSLRLQGMTNALCLLTHPSLHWVSEDHPLDCTNICTCTRFRMYTVGQRQGAVPHAASTQRHQETAGPVPADNDSPPSDLPADEGETRFDGPHPGLWQGIARQWRLACHELRSSAS